MYNSQTRSEIDPVKNLGSGLQWLNQSEKNLKKYLIFHMKKLKYNLCEYRPYML